MIGFDEQFRAYYEEALKLDWTGLDLWVFGGIVSGWETADIDSMIHGEADEARIAKLIQDLRKIGPWSTWYGGEIYHGRYDNKKVQLRAGYAHYTEPKIEWKWTKWPTTKLYMVLKSGKQYGAPIQLIQNGTQIYL